jgi:hypothetical protein
VRGVYCDGAGRIRLVRLFSCLAGTCLLANGLTLYQVVGEGDRPLVDRRLADALHGFFWVDARSVPARHLSVRSAPTIDRKSESGPASDERQASRPWVVGYAFRVETVMPARRGGKALCRYAAAGIEDSLARMSQTCLVRGVGD